MMTLAQDAVISPMELIVTSAVLFGMLAGAVVLAGAPVRVLLRRQEHQFDLVLRQRLLLDVSPRAAMIAAGVVALALALALFFATGGMLGAFIGLALGLALPPLVLQYLKKRRLARLEGQLVDGIQTLASGVRAGLNLVQAMQLVARDGPIPLRQEFAHMLREYEYGMPLEDAMTKAADRIGSGDFRLLFSALRTHRERGGDLGETLDRIADSIREIQRLEHRVKTLTAQGRATARFMGAMPIVVLMFLYLFQSESVQAMFADGIGKLILAAMLVLNVLGFLWIKKIVSLDI
jgi:tight adherence protein B